MDTYLSLLSFHCHSMRDKIWTLWCGYVWRENSCPLTFSRTNIRLMSHLLTADNRPGFLWNVDKYAFVYLLHINQYVSISTFWTEIQGCHLTQLVWYTRIIFRFFSYVAIIHVLWRGEYVGICWNQLQLGFPWSSQVTNGLKCYLLFRIPNLDSGFAANLE